MVHIHLDPLDTIFFRDSRPFTAGDEGFAESGLPSPLSLYGAIGSYYLNAKGISLINFKQNGDDKLGEYDDELAQEGLRIKGPFLYKDNSPYFAPPANLWRKKGTSQPRLLLPPELASPNENHDPSLELNRLRSADTSRLEPYNSSFISYEMLRNYLSGIIPMILEMRNEDVFYTTEQRVGHQRDSKTKTVTEGMLYSSQHLRLSETMSGDEKRVRTSLLVVAEQLEVGDFTLRSSCMGGERRSVKVTAENPDQRLFSGMDDVLAAIRQKKRFFLYLLTPAIFDQGWHPVPLVDATLVGAAVGKPEFISGWRNLAKEPRPLLKMVPAGAIYFYESELWNDAQYNNFFTTYHFNQSISDYYPNAGFGTTLLGTW